MLPLKLTMKISKLRTVEGAVLLRESFSFVEKKTQKKKKKTNIKINKEEQNTGV